MKSTLTKITLCFTLIIATMTSCLTGENEYHEIYFYPQRPEGIILFADQVTDTTTLVSYDSWTMTKEGDWFEASPGSQEIPAGSYGITRIGISTTPNTTGKNRTGRISINSVLSIATSVQQTSWLDITLPRPEYSYPGSEGTFSTLEAKFELQVLHNTQSASITFNTYSDVATLTSNAEWVKPKHNTFLKGTNGTTLEIQPNDSPEARTAQLSLTSKGVTTIIYVKQEGKKSI